MWPFSRAEVGRNTQMTTSDEDTRADPDSASYQELQRQHRADAQSLLSEYAERLSWPADRLRRERQEHLRELV